MKKLLHFLKLAWTVSPAYLILLILNALSEAAKSILNVILPMFLVNELTEARRIEMLIFYAGLIVANNVGMTLLTKLLTRFSSVRGVQVQEGMMKLMSEKIMNLEYSYLENPVYLDLKERAVFAINNQSAISNTIYFATEVISKAFTLIGLVSILITLGPVLIIVLAISIVLILLIYSGVSQY
ncbi:MAG: ABC transporter ATP-binding protein, partial [Agathobacter sp.]|nr:ABC transporter ATP-binding protein [Agathobacter sp.]